MQMPRVFARVKKKQHKREGGGRLFVHCLGPKTENDLNQYLAFLHSVGPLSKPHKP
jgi:hypothetical protein